jgi:hypothetical protein
MDGSGQVKDGIGRWYLTRVDEFIGFQAALITETHGTDVPATITFDAPVKLLFPVCQACGQVHAVHMGDGLLGPFIGLFPSHIIVRKGFETLAGIRQFLRAGNTHGYNFVWIQLIPGVKGLEAPLVAAPDKHAEGLLREVPGEIDEHFIQGITAVTGLVMVPDDETFEIVSLAKEVGRHVAVSLAEAQKTLDLTSLEKFFYFFFDLVNHKTPLV